MTYFSFEAHHRSTDVKFFLDRKCVWNATYKNSDRQERKTIMCLKSKHNANINIFVAQFKARGWLITSA